MQPQIPQFVVLTNWCLDSLTPFFKHHTKETEVIFDQEPKLWKQIKAIAKSCFFQLITITKIKLFISFRNRFNFLSLIFCFPFLLSGLLQCLVCWDDLQPVQNAAAQLISEAKKGLCYPFQLPFTGYQFTSGQSMSFNWLFVNPNC